MSISLLRICSSSKLIFKLVVLLWNENPQFYWGFLKALALQIKTSFDNINAVCRLHKKSKEVSYMDENSLAHTKWNCKYHVVFAPKYRRQVIYKHLKKDIGNII